MSDITYSNGLAHFKGVPILGPMLKSYDGSDPRQFGIDAGGGPMFFMILHADQTFVASLDNPTSDTQALSYSIQKGSEIGFSQSASITVEVSGGIDLGGITFGTNVSATGSLGFTQAFSKATSVQVSASVKSGKSMMIYEGVLMVQYLSLYALPNPNIQGGIIGYIWAPLKKDVIDTGVYGLVESNLVSIAHQGA